MPTISSYSLRPYGGEWKEDELLHLLRRCLFGVGHKELNFYKGKSLDQCLNALLLQSPTPAPASEEPFAELTDPLVPLGKTWVNAPFENDYINYTRRIMLRIWWSGLIINRDFSLTEKMTLFWHNHFATEMDVVKDSRYTYHYVALLRANSLGSFRKLIRDGSTNSAMLVYLGGNTNFKSAPNENYARELMELFTLGKGYGVQYTESDVKAAARVLTGWRDDKEKIVSVFDPEQHDTADKHFSSFFSNAVISGKKGMEGAKEIDELIEIIFRKKEVARYVCRNIYRWFVYAHVDDRIENEIIAPLADIFIRNNYEVASVLQALLSSEHFFDPAFRGCIVKSPADFLIGSAQQIGVFVYNPSRNTNLVECHEAWLLFHFFCEDLTMRIGDPPSVAGWPAFYQTPKYHQWWINSAILSMRKKFSDQMCTHEGLIKNGYNVCFDFLSYVKQFPNPGDLDAFVQRSVQLLCAVPPSASSVEHLKDLLTSGMDKGHYWEKAWEKLSEHPDDKETAEVLQTRLRLFYAKLFSMPEYQMM